MTPSARVGDRASSKSKGATPHEAHPDPPPPWPRSAWWPASDETDTTRYAEPNCKASAWQTNTDPPCTVPVSIDDHRTTSTWPARSSGRARSCTTPSPGWPSTPATGTAPSTRSTTTAGPWTHGWPRRVGEAADEGGAPVITTPTAATGTTTYEYGTHRPQPSATAGSGGLQRPFAVAWPPAPPPGAHVRTHDLQFTPGTPTWNPSSCSPSADCTLHADAPGTLTCGRLRTSWWHQGSGRAWNLVAWYEDATTVTPPGRRQYTLWPPTGSAWATPTTTFRAALVHRRASPFRRKADGNDVQGVQGRHRRPPRTGVSRGMKPAAPPPGRRHHRRQAGRGRREHLRRLPVPTRCTTSPGASGGIHPASA